MRMKLLTCSIAMLLSGSVLAANGESVFVTAQYQNLAQLRKVGGEFQHLAHDAKARTIRVEVDEDQMRMLEKAGFKITVDQAVTGRIQEMKSALSAHPGLGMSAIPGYACYRTVEETYDTINQLVTSKPTLASVANIGPSWAKSKNPSAGYDMKVLKLTNSATNPTNPNKPSMVVLGSIHAREYTPAELTTRFAEWLVNGYGTDDEATWLMDNYQFYLVLQANPDGRKKAEAVASWRKNVNNTNGCTSGAYGTDLNRNWPFHWNTTNGGGSSGSCSAETYRGPTAGSDQETQNLVKLIAGTKNASGVFTGGLLPDRRADDDNAAAPEDYQGLFFDIHSYSQLVLWPWGDTTKQTSNATALQTLGRRMAYFNSYTPEQSVGLYPTDGTTDDTVYGYLGAPSYTIELGVAFFESCSEFTGSTLPKNLQALRYAARNLWAPYKLPAGPDTNAISISVKTVPAGTPVTVTATVSDAGFNQSNGTEPTQNITSAKAYVDATPWATNASGVAMTAKDGSFNSPTEQVTLSIPTAGLSGGRHVVFVQGTDAAGKPGTPNAVYFTVEGGTTNKPPVAGFTSTSSGLTARFTDTSRDEDGSIKSYQWDFGDGASSTEASPSHAYAKNGTYTVVLTVTDDKNATDSETQAVTVGDTGSNVLQNGVPVTASGAQGEQKLWTMTVPAGQSALTFTASGGSGDADLYVKFGSAPTKSSYDCRPYTGGNNETCTINNVQAGTYYVMLDGYRAYSGLTLVGSYGGGSKEYPNETDYAINDAGAAIESPVTVDVSGQGAVASRVTVDITHPYIGDLVVELVAPDGTAYMLHNRTGGSADNIRNTYTVDLSSEQINGSWKLRVRDAARGDVGTLNRWSLAF